MKKHLPWKAEPSTVVVMISFVERPNKPNTALIPQGRPT